MKMRLFIGIETGTATPALLNAANYIGEISGGIPVNRKNIHLNLKFLGNDIIPKEIPTIKKAMQKAFLGEHQFFLSSDGVIDLKKYGLTWCLLSGETGRLEYLKDKLDDILYDMGFKVTGQKYIPHITLVRNGRQKWDINNVKIEKTIFKVKRIVLFESIVENGENYNIPIYTIGLV